MRHFPVYLVMVNPDEVRKWNNYVWCDNEFGNVANDIAALKLLMQEFNPKEVVASDVSIVCFDNDESVRLVQRFRFGDKGVVGMPSFTCDSIDSKLMFAAIREFSNLPSKAKVME